MNNFYVYRHVNTRSSDFKHPPDQLQKCLTGEKMEFFFPSGKSMSCEHELKRVNNFYLHRHVMIDKRIVFSTMDRNRSTNHSLMVKAFTGFWKVDFLTVTVLLGLKGQV